MGIGNAATITTDKCGHVRIGNGRGMPRSYGEDHDKFKIQPLKQTKGNKMKSTILTRTTGAALFAALAMPAQIMAQGEQEQKAERFPHYRVIDLGTLGGTGTNSAAYDMNNAGWAAGSSNLIADGPQHAFLWYGRGPLKDLGTLGGSACPNCNSEAGGPNARGEAAVISETSKKAPLGEDFCGFDTHLQCLGAIWKKGRLTALPTLGGYNGQALGLNNQGQVVGWAETKFKEEKGDCATPFQRFDFEAVIWGPNGEIQKLDPLPGDTVGFAFGINDHGPGRRRVGFVLECHSAA
jgi:probable HAF family extracellular repeat protein